MAFMNLIMSGGAGGNFGGAGAGSHAGLPGAGGIP